VKLTRALLLVLAVFAQSVAGTTGESGEIIGPYLGQEPPGVTPQLFAPGIVSVDAHFEHSAAVFSPDGREVFWCARRNMYSGEAGDDTQRLLYMKESDGRWTAPHVAPFTAHLAVPIQRPVFSPDGNSLYLEYFSDPTRESDTDIYVSRREGGEWSEPEPVSPSINTAAVERLCCVTSDGSMYFARDLMTPREEILVSHLIDGQFTEPERLGVEYNSDATELALVISPDGDYMLIDQTLDQRSDKLLVCYREADGSWTERVSTPYSCGGFMALSPDGKYLFFLGEGIHWVSTSFVEELRPERLRGVNSTH
jgi:hypothetical protein